MTVVLHCARALQLEFESERAMQSFLLQPCSLALCVSMCPWNKKKAKAKAVSESLKREQLREDGGLLNVCSEHF